MSEEMTKQEAMERADKASRYIAVMSDIVVDDRDMLALDAFAHIVREQDAEIERLKETVRLTDLHSVAADKRAEAAEAERDELLAQVYSLSGRSWQQCFLDADKENISLRERLKAAEKKSEALDRLEEMKDKDMRWELLGGDGSYKVYHPVIVTGWHDTITDAITEAYERTRP